MNGPMRVGEVRVIYGPKGEMVKRYEALRRPLGFQPPKPKPPVKRPN